MAHGFDIIHSWDDTHPILQVEYLDDFMFFNSWRIMVERNDISYKELEESKEYIQILKDNSVEYN